MSGGPDSLALLALAAASAAALRARGYALAVATVDHGLRSGSGAEAAHVGAVSRSLGLAHETRRWIGDKPVSNLQDAARTARYGLLVDAALDLGAVAVMTAHHEDDQIETHLLAKARKAGDRGLAAMRLCRALSPGLHLLRPFLAVPGARLKAIASGLAAIDDPSNRDERFDRVRLRATIAGGGLDRQAVLGAIARHAARRDVADLETAGTLARLLQAGLMTFDPSGIVRVEASGFRALPAETAMALLARILAAVAGQAHPPLFAAMERLHRRLTEGRGGGGGQAATLGGVRIETRASITFSREFGRTGPRAVPLPVASGRLLFDGRFDIDLSGDLHPSATAAVPFGALGLGHPGERTLPVLVDAQGAPLAAPDALLRKLGRGVRPLRLAERVSWACLRDLPPAET